MKKRTLSLTNPIIWWRLGPKQEASGSWFAKSMQTAATEKNASSSRWKQPSKKQIFHFETSQPLENNKLLISLFVY